MVEVPFRTVLLQSYSTKYCKTKEANDHCTGKGGVNESIGKFVACSRIGNCYCGPESRHETTASNLAKTIMLRLHVQGIMTHAWHSDIVVQEFIAYAARVELA